MNFESTLAPIREHLKDIEAGKTTRRAWLESLLERANEVERDVKAWITLDADGARAAADAADLKGTGGLLGGVPFAAKDNYDTHDLPTAYGSPIHAKTQPARDAAAIALMRMSGAILMGKTVTTEFAHRHPGATANPANPAHTPGGSSSGSAAAVAAGMTPLAFGSQTTGSVIRPAAYCGVVGYKPTHGQVNASGMLANTPSFDTVGLMSQHVDDLVMARGALLAESVNPLESVSLRGSTIGISRGPFWSETSDAMQELIEGSASALGALGARIIEFDDQGAFDNLAEYAQTISGFEFARTMAHERLYAFDRLSDVLREGRMTDGLEADLQSYTKAIRAVERQRLGLDAAFDAVDVVITPPSPGSAPVGLHYTGSANLNLVWTTLHTPAVTIPAGRDTQGLPLGLQICGPRHSDIKVLAFSQQLHKELRAT